jgi:hypothetical protein
MKYVSIFGLNKYNAGWRFYTQAIDGADTILLGQARRFF